MSAKRKLVRNTIRRKYSNKAVRSLFRAFQGAKNKKRFLRKVIR